MGQDKISRNDEWTAYMSYLEHENAVFWTRAHFYLAASAGLLGLTAAGLLSPKDAHHAGLGTPGGLETAVHTALPCVGIVISLLWWHALWAGNKWVRLWEEKIKDIDRSASGAAVEDPRPSDLRALKAAAAPIPLLVLAVLLLRWLFGTSEALTKVVAIWQLSLGWLFVVGAADWWLHREEEKGEDSEQSQGTGRPDTKAARDAGQGANGETEGAGATQRCGTFDAPRGHSRPGGPCGLKTAGYAAAFVSLTLWVLLLRCVQPLWGTLALAVWLPLLWLVVLRGILGELRRSLSRRAATAETDVPPLLWTVVWGAAAVGGQAVWIFALHWLFTSP